MKNGVDSPSIEALLYHAQKEGILPITSCCNMRCLFCSNRYNPPGCEVLNIPARRVEDIKDTILWLGGSRGPVVIGESVTRINEGEPLTHPNFLEIIRLVRKSYPERPIRVTTNASLLDKSLIQDLSDLEVELLISLNTIGRRKEVMEDPDPERTLYNISLLRGKIRFEGSIVALPFLVGWDDIRDTVKFLEDNGATLVRMLVPGFSSLHPLVRYVTSTIWSEVRDFAHNLAKTIKIPILVEPPDMRDLSARITEVLPGTPARKAGLRPGDVIVRVQGRKVFSRKESFEMVRDTKDPEVSYEREGGLYDVTLVKERFASPGFIMYEDLDAREWFEWERKSGVRKGKKVLILTSALAKPIIKAALQKRKLSARVEAVPSTFFGGNIRAAGLLTIKDFLAKYQEILAFGFTPDVVTLPKRAFDPWGRDLEGQDYRIFSERTGRPVILAG